MAKKEEKISTPAYVDYDGGEEADTERWNSTNAESYWRGALIRDRKLGAHPWTIKHKALCKRVIKEFGVESLKQMIAWWTHNAKLEEAASFEAFYARRYKVYDKAKPKDYTEWE